VVKAILKKDCREPPWKGIGFSRAVRDENRMPRRYGAITEKPGGFLAVGPDGRVSQY